MVKWYSETWGIRTGDVLSSIGAMHELVVLGISEPHYVDKFVGTLCVRTWPVVQVECTYKGGYLDSDRTVLVNDIRRIGDHYFTDQNARVVIDKPSGSDPIKRLERNVRAWPSDLESIVKHLGDAPPLTPAPYSFDAEVDYSIPRNVWKCNNCGKDFNAPFRIEYVKTSVNRRDIGPCLQCGTDVASFLTPYSFVFVLQRRPNPHLGTFSPYGFGWIDDQGEHCPPTSTEAYSYHTSSWDQLLPGYSHPWEIRNGYLVRERRPWR